MNAPTTDTSTAKSSSGTLTFKLRSEPAERLNLSALIPGKLAAMNIADIERLDIGTGPRAVHLGDAFAVTGTPGDTVIIEGGSGRLDFIGETHTGGTIIVDGDAGAYAGRKMRAGRLEIRGNAGAYLASAMLDGLVTVAGSAGDYLGAPRAGEKDGITGGSIIVTGPIGHQCAARMRRGLVVSKTTIGAFAGNRMMGGTIWAAGGFGPGAGCQMRRGTLITPTLDDPLPTFLDCGVHDLGILHIMSRHYAAALGKAAPVLPSGPVRRFAGDMAHLGRGEILVTA